MLSYCIMLAFYISDFVINFYKLNEILTQKNYKIYTEPNEFSWQHGQVVKAPD